MAITVQMSVSVELFWSECLEGLRVEYFGEQLRKCSPSGPSRFYQRW